MRAMGTRVTVRRVAMSGVSFDERLQFNAVGGGIGEPRARLSIVLQGLSEVTTPLLVELRPGLAFWQSLIGPVSSRGNEGAHQVLELDWRLPLCRRAADGYDVFVPSKMCMAAAWRLWNAFDQQQNTVHALRTALGDLEYALLADGLGWIEPDESLEVSRDTQRTMSAIDESFCNFDTQPSMVDLEARLHKTRRAIHSDIENMHEAFGLCGVSSKRGWRAERDFYRLSVGLWFAGAPDITTERLAKCLGYRSPDALCHAFAHVGLPSPGRVREILNRMR